MDTDLRSDLAGRKLFVTGAGSGIGRATVALALADGAHVVGLARDAAEAALLAELLPGTHIVVHDLEAGAGGLAGRAAGLLGGLDGVVTAAGIFDHRRGLDADRAGWDRVLAVNLSASFEVARDAALLMPRGGSVVLVSSQIGLVGHAHAAAYTASKAGVNGLAKALALECAALGVRVNAVAPGPIATPMTAATRADPVRGPAMVAKIPLGRLGRAEEIAAVIRFLLAPASGFVTGHVLVADGGFTAA
jgi:NAD(P)-dependent dehydrogenase (short-subunit alcohol dehydrogenase family)